MSGPQFKTGLDGAIGEAIGDAWREPHGSAAIAGGAGKANVWAIADIERIWRCAEHHGRALERAAPRADALPPALLVCLFWMGAGLVEGAAIVSVIVWLCRG